MGIVHRSSEWPREVVVWMNWISVADDDDDDDDEEEEEEEEEERCISGLWHPLMAS
eukprot:COSAG01_NODE_36380_length_518_cov_2.525060_1_plen_55_part_10